MALSPLTITNFVLAGGPATVNPVAYGEMSIRLDKDCMGPEGQVSTRTTTVQLDANGAPIGSPLFWPNNDLTPADSQYLISVKNENGERILQWQGTYVGPYSPPQTGFGSAFGGSFGSSGDIMATISYGPNLGLINNAAINQVYVNQLRQFLQAADQLIMGNVINATTVVPPTSPSNGDAYLLSTGTPSGAWTGQGGNIAVWTTQFTLAGTNTLSPRWVFYQPKPGWILWNQALATLVVDNGSAWAPLSGGANFPTNTDITSMTGIPNTTINNTGYAFNDGTDPATTIGATWQLGAGTFGSVSTVQIGDQVFSGTGYTGLGIGVSSSTEFSLLAPGAISTSGTVTTQLLHALTSVTTGELLVGSTGTGTITAASANQTVSIGGLGFSTNTTSVLINSGQVSPSNGVGLLGFDPNYYTQTTVGAAGSASVIPGAPKKWIQLCDTDGSIVVFPVWARS